MCTEQSGRFMSTCMGWTFSDWFNWLAQSLKEECLPKPKFSSVEKMKRKHCDKYEGNNASIHLWQQILSTCTVCTRKSTVDSTIWRTPFLQSVWKNSVPYKLGLVKNNLHKQRCRLTVITIEVDFVILLRSFVDLCLSDPHCSERTAHLLLGLIQQHSNLSDVHLPHLVPAHFHHFFLHHQALYKSIGIYLFYDQDSDQHGDCMPCHGLLVFTNDIWWDTKCVNSVRCPDTPCSIRCKVCIFRAIHTFILNIWVTKNYQRNTQVFADICKLETRSMVFIIWSKFCTSTL